MPGRPAKQPSPRSGTKKQAPAARRQVPPVAPRPGAGVDRPPEGSAFGRITPANVAPAGVAPVAWRPARTRQSGPSDAAPRTAAKPAAVQPGPAPLAAGDRLPVLSKVGGAAGTRGALEFVSFRSRALAELQPHALGVTYWFDPPESAGSFSVVVRFVGHRLDVEGTRAAADDFVSVASLPSIRSGSGRSALTHRVRGVAAGRWHVTAQAMAVPAGAAQGDGLPLPAAEGVGSTTFAPVAGARAPGVVLGAWPTLVSVGVVLALVLQSLLVRAHGLAPVRVLMLSLLASGLGAMGARGYYRLTHLRERGGRWLAGLSVQGFVIVATATFVVGGSLLGVDIGHLLDATVPALLLGQAVGRLGCLFGGCCAGVPTDSRWALWSSDRSVGTRRVPVQLMESAAAASLAVITGLVAWRTPPSSAGVLFVVGVAAYVIVRQVLFPMRGVPRATRHGRTVTLAAASLVLLASLVAWTLA